MRVSGTISRVLFLALGVLAGCENGKVGGVGGTGGNGGGAGVTGNSVRGDGGHGVGPTGPNLSGCDGDKDALIWWRLTPAVAAMSGIVARKSVGADGAQEMTIVDDGGLERELTLRAPTPAPLREGDRIDV